MLISGDEHDAQVRVLDAGLFGTDDEHDDELCSSDRCCADDLYR